MRREGPPTLYPPPFAVPVSRPPALQWGRSGSPALASVRRFDGALWEQVALFTNTGALLPSHAQRVAGKRADDEVETRLLLKRELRTPCIFLRRSGSEFQGCQLFNSFSVRGTFGNARVLTAGNRMN